MNTNLTFIAAELAAISDELDAASEKLGKYDTAIDLEKVKTGDDLLDVLETLCKHVMTMGLHDPECIVAELDNAMNNVQFNINEMDALEAEALSSVEFNRAERSAGRMFNGDALRAASAY